MSKHPGTLFVGHPLIRLGEVDSTNSCLLTLATKSAPSEGTAVVADFQSAGSGQFGSNWQSEPGANLLVSVLLRPTFVVRPAYQFMISRVAALAVAGLLRDEGFEPSIKWPNDILLGDRKVCGILIQSAIAGDCIRHTVVGIGLNVNQMSFSPDLPLAGSLAMASGRVFDREALLQGLFFHLEALWLRLRAGAERELLDAYHASLHRLDQPARYIQPGGVAFTGTLRGVTQEGLLLLQPEGDDSPRTFDLKSISFL